jgi:hypothetical protein
MLNVITRIAIMLNVVKPSVVMLGVITLSVVMLSVVELARSLYFPLPRIGLSRKCYTWAEVSDIENTLAYFTNNYYL